MPIPNANENPLSLGSKKPASRKILLIGVVALFLMSVLLVLAFAFGMSGM